MDRTAVTSRPGDRSSRGHPEVAFEAAQVAGLQQHLQGLQQNVQGLQQKLDAIKSLERSLSGRGESGTVRRK